MRKWFEWSTDMQPVKEELLKNKTIRRAGTYLIASRIS